ncbi:MAG TPA: hydroxyacid dehydrogenase [Thermoplasmata archaeon]|nr:hydroxyacid dehydrogenase [Thermoplasmata archaeon]
MNRFPRKGVGAIVPEEPRAVVLADAIDAEAVRLLETAPCRVVDATEGAAALEPQLASAWALVVRSRTKVTKEVIDRAPRLALIARAGVGVDNVDLAAAAARGIRVVNAPTAATTSVAELTVALVLFLVRELWGSIAATKGGTWKRGLSGHELSGRTVGFVGYGRIAREAARRLAPFGVQSIAFDPFVRETGDATHLVPLDDLLARADVVSLHAALTKENVHLMNADRIGRMKRGAFLVNVARGPLVDESALLPALASGQLAGVALDVFEIEPPRRTELLEHPHVLATPHLGASTPEAQGRAGRIVVDELLRALRGEPLRFEVPAEVAPGA